MIGVGQIKAMIPHRYPMLLVDRVIDLEPGTKLTAIKAVTCNEPWYRGIPEDAVDEQYAFPPVLLIESWCQAAGLLSAYQQPVPDVLAGQVMLFGGMAGVRFRGRVVPGDLLEHRVRLVRSFRDAAVFEGESVVGRNVVLEVGRVSMAMRPAAHLSGTAHRAAPARVGR